MKTNPHSTTRSLVLAALFLALAFVLPMITGHVPQVGNMLCPMHFPILLCGFVLGGPWGLAVGFIAPLVRSVLFGMPPMFPIAISIAFELAAYGLVSGVLWHKVKHTVSMMYASLVTAMVAGRLVWGAVRFVLALSDGMGSGISARQESHAALELMVESLRAGYTRAQALDVVNALMLMCTGREMYATMDLCVCDLHSGETAFEKLGACASYIVRDGEVRTIGADTLPVGVLPDVESRSLRMTLQAGDVVVMMTDGVRDAYPGGEIALREDIGKLAWLHPQSVGEKLIARAVGSGEVGDDMAILCARMSKTVLE